MFFSLGRQRVLPSPSACGCSLSQGERLVFGTLLPSDIAAEGSGALPASAAAFPSDIAAEGSGETSATLPQRFPGDFGYFWRPKVPHRCRTRRRPALSFVRSTPPVNSLHRLRWSFSLAERALSGRRWNPPLRPSPSACGCHLSRGGRGLPTVPIHFFQISLVTTADIWYNRTNKNINWRAP